MRPGKWIHVGHGAKIIYPRDLSAMTNGSTDKSRCNYLNAQWLIIFTMAHYACCCNHFRFKIDLFIQGGVESSKQD